MKAVAEGQNGCVKLLIEKGVNVDAFENFRSPFTSFREVNSEVTARTALMIAVSNGKIDCMKSLLEAKPKVDMEKADSEGKTALVYALLRDKNE